MVSKKPLFIIYLRDIIIKKKKKKKKKKKVESLFYLDKKNKES